MKIEYTYAAGVPWWGVLEDMLNLIIFGDGGAVSYAINGGKLVTGSPVAGWTMPMGGRLALEAKGKSPGAIFDFQSISGAAVDTVMVTPIDALTGQTGVSPWVVVAGQNSLSGGDTGAQGTVRIMVAERAIAFSFAYGAGRQLALIGECDGEYFGNANFPRNFVMSSQAVVSGSGMDGLAKVPYFPRVKNPAAAGVKTGLNACGLALTAGISATNGWVYGINETLNYQALPLEVFSSPKAAHLGFVDGVLLAPCKAVANDDVLIINGEAYTVFRENATAAVAIAMKA